MKKLTNISVIGLAIILFSLLGMTYYVKRNYVPPPPISLTDSLALVSDTLLSHSDSTFASLTSNSDTASRQRVIDSAAIALNMVVTNVLSDSMAKMTSAPAKETIETAKKAVEGDVKEIKSTLQAEGTRKKEVTVTSKGVESGKYYVVVGSFSQEVNAKDEMKYSKRSDYSIIKDGQYYRIIAGEYPSAKTAKQHSSELTKEGISNFVIQR